MRNIQHPTSNIQRRSKIQDPKSTAAWAMDLGAWIFSGCWMLDVRCFARVCFLAIVTFTASPFPTHGQATNPTPANRYLFIVETSHSMQRRSDEMLAAFQPLLNSVIR